MHYNNDLPCVGMGGGGHSGVSLVERGSQLHRTHQVTTLTHHTNQKDRLEFTKGTQLRGGRLKCSLLLLLWKQREPPLHRTHQDTTLSHQESHSPGLHHLLPEGVLELSLLQHCLVLLVLLRVVLSHQLQHLLTAQGHQHWGWRGGSGGR